MHEGRGSLSPSEKLNHLSECEQSEYERVKSVYLYTPRMCPMYTPIPPPFVLRSQTSLKPGLAASFEILLQYASGGELTWQFRTSDFPLPMRRVRLRSRTNQEGFVINEAA